MGKQGPCYHCGVTITPLWRNGPPDKPVLCNACGSRWRTKGTLLNYTPLHARADPADYEDQRVAQVKSISINKNKDAKVLKRKHVDDSMETNWGGPLEYNSGFSKYVEEDMSNRSSSGSAMSNSDVQFESADASDLTGPAQSVVWDSMVPSRKRTCTNRLKQSSVEKLTRDLHAIMHEQQSSCLSASSEEDLLLESSTPMCSFEIGHGTMIFRDPSSIAREEESEASSLSVDRKRYKASEGYSGVTNFSLLRGGKPVSISPNPRMIKRPTDRGLDQEQLKRKTSQHESLQILRNHNSPLNAINPEEDINVEEFMKCLTYEEEQLLKYIPSGDKAHLLDRLRTLFGSSEFKENLSSCPQLFAEGFSGSSYAKAEDFKTLKKIVLFNLMKCKKVESHPLVEESRNSSKSSTGGLNTLQATASSTLVGGKRPCDLLNQNFSDEKVMTSPKRPGLKGGFENREIMDNEGSCFSPRSLFAFPPDSSSLMFDSSPFAEDNSDQDLLLNVPSYSSFPQAELLHPHPASSFGSQPQQASTSCSSFHQHAMHPR